MRTTRLLAIAVACAATSAAWATPTPPTLEVAVGGQAVLNGRGVTRVALASNVADVHVLGRDVLVTGLEVGVTSLTLWYGKRRITRRVRVVDHQRLDEVNAAFSRLGIDGLQTVQVGDRVVVDGVVEDLETWRKLHALKEAAPYISVLARMDGAIYAHVATVINEALVEAGIEGAHVKARGSTLFLEGSVSDEGDRQKAERIALAIRNTLL